MANGFGGELPPDPPAGDDGGFIGPLPPEDFIGPLPPDDFIGPPEPPGGVGDPNDPNAFQRLLDKLDLDLGDLLNVAIGVGSGISNARAQNKALEEQKRRIERARALASPEQLVANLKALRPQFRELIAAGLGPQFQQGIASFLGRTGLGDTGVGATIGASAVGAPEIFAFSAALNQARSVQAGQVSAELGLAATLPPGVEENPILVGLERAAGVLFQSGTVGGRDKDTTSTSSQELPLFPGLER